MSGAKRHIADRSLLVFFALCFVLSWGLWMPLVIGREDIPAVTPLAAIAMVAFMIFPGSATSEEIGWRGYALPRLQVGRSALSASLILGTVHALWHLPLWLRGTAVQPLSLYPAFAIQVVAYALIYTWLYNSTRGSLLLVVLFHAATNAPLTLVVAPIAGSDALPVIFWLITGLTALWAVIVVAIFHPLNLSRDNRQQADDLTTSQRDTALDFDPNKHLQRG